ncbi:putative sphingomyelin phosphodiesterase [Paramicrosporidium saccamoebae]|uniref:Putative sphingomyelin phosphodiesterase n=1 Tax=Paramicrosporidium saccamoebae TaxID=1246581 RepID=A0A2H9TNP7_9FUNG|nr:putative sphingomyelin phosphodiesterase [Paramicrosporidium saccamoebae]
MAATELTLDRLQQQVQAGSCRVAAACTRLENVIQTLCKDEMTRPFLTVLPRILSLLFGDEHNAGWIETTTDEDSIHALWTLLKPAGNLFMAASAHSGLDCVTPFELAASQLPVPLQKHLQRYGINRLPVPLDTCIVNVAHEGASLYILRLDASEFFIYRMLVVLLSFRKHHGVGMQSSRSASMMALARSHSFESMNVKISGEKAFRFNSNRSAQLYQKLIEAYLHYFMPIAGYDDAKVGSAFSTKSLRSAAGVWTGWRLASLFFTGISQLWLHQHEYQIEASSHIESDPPFILPSVDHFEAIRVVTRHLVTAVCYPVKPDISPQLQRFYDQLVDVSFVSFRAFLYRLLRLSLAKCPSDNTVTVVGGLWLDFIAPWRYLTIGTDRQESTAAWRLYVVNNYFFYHTLLSSLLDYVEVIAEGFGEVLSSKNNVDTETIRSALLPLLILCTRILTAISPFSDLIQEIENDELVATRSATPTFLRRATSSQGVKEQLFTLESERFTLLPLFDEKSKHRALRIMYWFEKIYTAFPEAVGADSEATESRHVSHDERHANLRSVITQCNEELCAVFGIRDGEFDEFCPKFEDNRRLQIVMPVEARRRRVIPTSLPDERITLKMKATPEAKHLIKSYESAFLVHLTGWLTILINENYAKFMQDRTLPNFVKKYQCNLRFLAAYPNLMFIAMVFLGMRLLVSLFF